MPVQRGDLYAIINGKAVRRGAAQCPETAYEGGAEGQTFDRRSEPVKRTVSRRFNACFD